MIHTFSIYNVIHDAFKKTCDHIGTLLKGMVIAVAIFVGLCAVLGLLNYANILAASNVASIVHEVVVSGIDWASTEAVASLIFKIWSYQSGFALIFLILSVVTLFIAFTYLIVGMQNYVLCVYNRGTARVQDLFVSLRTYCKMMAANFLYMSICFIGLILLVLPGIYCALRFGRSTYFILDQHMGIFEAFAASWKTARGSMFKLFILNCFSLLLGGIAKLTIFGGLLVTPFGYMLAVSTYHYLLQASPTNE